MTIAANAVNRVQTTGNGSTTAYPYNYPFLTQSELTVVSTVIATGEDTVKVLDTDYTISGTPDALGNYPDGGTVNFVTAPAGTEQITIYGSPALSQGLDLEDLGDFNAENIEATFDKLTLLVRQLNDILNNRTLRQPLFDVADIDTLPSKTDRASMYLGFDSDGDPIALAAPADTTAVSAFVATLLDDISPYTFLATLRDAINSGLGPMTTPGLTEEMLIRVASSGNWQNITMSNLSKVTGGKNIETMVAATSGTAINFTSLPTGIKRIKVLLKDVSTNGTGHLWVQIGDAGGIENTSYAANSVEHNPTGPVLSLDTETAAFTIFSDSAANQYTGVITLDLMDAATNLWICSHTIHNTANGRLITGAGFKALSATLDRVRLTTDNGTDTFDNGSVNVVYER